MLERVATCYQGRAVNKALCQGGPIRLRNSHEVHLHASARTGSLTLIAVIACCRLSKGEQDICCEDLFTCAHIRIILHFIVCQGLWVGEPCNLLRKGSRLIDAVEMRLAE